jgi:hypothetical protein
MHTHMLRVKWPQPPPHTKKRGWGGAAICNPHMLHAPKAILKALGLPVLGSIRRFQHNNITI